MNKLYNTFENQLRDKMAGHELPYDPSHWNDLQSSMKPKGRSSSALLVALFASLTFIGGATYVSYMAINSSSAAKIASTKGLGLPTANTLAQSISSNINNTIDTPNPGITQNTESPNASNSYMANNSNGNSNEGNWQVNEQPFNFNTHSNAIQTIDSSDATEITNIPTKKSGVAFAPSVSVACAGTSVEFNVTSLPDGETNKYIWNFGDGKFTAERTPSNVYTKPGQYDVSLSITDDNGRISTTVLSKAITIVPTPKADFSWHFDNIDPEKPHVTIVNESENATSSTWTTKDGLTNAEMSPSFELSSQGKQMLALHVANQNGCTNGTVKHISVNSDLQIGAPTAMKVGKENFMPEALKSNKYNFVLTIYDQNNQVVFETKNRKGWEGQLSNGNLASVGQAYKWKVILINDLTQEEKYFNGTLNIIP